MVGKDGLKVNHQPTHPPIIRSVLRLYQCFTNQALIGTPVKAEPDFDQSNLVLQPNKNQHNQGTNSLADIRGNGRCWGRGGEECRHRAAASPHHRVQSPTSRPYKSDSQLDDGQCIRVSVGD